MEGSEKMKQLYLQLKKYKMITLISDIKLPESVVVKKQNGHIFVKHDNKEYECTGINKNIYSYSGIFNEDSYADFKIMPVENVCTLQEIKKINVLFVCTALRPKSTLLRHPGLVFDKLKELYSNYTINLFMIGSQDDVKDENKKQEIEKMEKDYHVTIDYDLKNLKKGFLMDVLKTMDDNMFDVIVFSGCNTTTWLFGKNTKDESNQQIDIFLNKLKSTGYLFAIEHSVGKDNTPVFMNIIDWPGVYGYKKYDKEKPLVDYMMDKMKKIQTGIYQKK